MKSATKLSLFNAVKVLLCLFLVSCGGGDSATENNSTPNPPVIDPPVTEPPVIEPPVIEPPVAEPPLVDPPVDKPKSADLVVELWGNSSSQADSTAAAQYSGLYALANRSSDVVEVFTIDQQKVAEISAAQLNAKLPSGFDISGSDYGPVALAFSASGRFLFIAVNTSGDNDAILRFNTGNKALTGFVSNINIASIFSQGSLGLAHHNGELWLGTASGKLLRYQAKGNDNKGKLLTTVNLTDDDTGKAIYGIAVDSIDNTAYVGTENNLYRLNLSNQTIGQIATVNSLKSLSYGRNYGGDGQGGLYLLNESNGNSGQFELNFIASSSLREQGSVTAKFYSKVDEARAIAATADGKMLLAAAQTKLLSDDTDTRMTYTEWLRNEFDQYMTFIRSACWPEGKREGWVSGTEPKPDQGRYRAYSTGAAGWAALMLMTDEAMFGNSAEAEIQAIITRFAGLHPDGIGPEVTTDGLYYGDYFPETGVKSGYPSIYSTAKIVNAAIHAREFYPENDAIVTAANQIIGMQKNYADYLRDYAQVEHTGVMFGPEAETRLQAVPPYQESYLFAELAAAQDPMAVNAYEDWWKHRENHASLTSYLSTEPVIKWNISSFVEQYGHIVFKDRRVNADWRENFDNLYAHYAAWTDDNNPDYLTVFSAGPTKTEGYNADKIYDHPDTISHFPGLLGFGMYGSSVPMVGGYFAYRDGKRQKMRGQEGVFGPNATIGAEILTRYSNEDKDWQPNRLGIPDMVFGLYGLVEQLTDADGNKGIIDRLIARDASPADFAVHPSYGHSVSNFEAEGQLMNVINGDFSAIKNGWATLNNDFLYYAPSDANSIDGRSGEIRSTTDTVSEFGRFQQTIDMSEVVSLTPFILRAEGKIFGAGSEDQAYVKIEWDEDADPSNSSAFSAELSNVLDADDYDSIGGDIAQESFDITTRKPVGANYAHISFEVKRNLNVDAKYIRTFFDNLTLRSLRIDLVESSDGTWNTSKQGSRASATINGGKVDFAIPNGTNKDDYAEVYRDFELDADDPLGTRYVVTANVDTANIDEAEFLIYVEIRSTSEPTHFRQAGADVVFSSVTGRDIYYSGRRLESHEDQLRVFIRFKKKWVRSYADQTATLNKISFGKQAPSF